jgi:hypothetical protein
MLESGTGPVPSLAPAIVGTSIRGSWWSHPQSREIFALTRAIRGCPDVLVCRLIDKKITYVHRRLWSALVRLSGRFSSNQLAQICEVHTPFGKHIIQEVQFPSWVPEEVAEQASTIGEDDALGQLGRWCAKKNSVPAGA